MVSLVALYKKPLQTVLELWRDSYANLGLRQLDELPERKRGSWTTFRLRNTRLCFGVWESNTGNVWADLYSRGAAYRRYEEVFWKILKYHPACFEAAVVDDASDCSGPMLGFVPGERDADSFFAALLQNYRGGTRQIRAIDMNILNEPEQWLKSARKLGLEASISRQYLVVDVHWEQRGQRIRRSPSRFL